MSGWIKLSDDSAWPIPHLGGDDNSDVEWKLRYAPESITRKDQLRAASIISAYEYLVAEATRSKRDLVAREIRAALKGYTDE